MSLRINIHINIDESEPLAAKQYGKACHRHACDENTTRVKEPKEGEKKKVRDPFPTYSFRTSIREGLRGACSSYASHVYNEVTAVGLSGVCVWTCI
jgi:hypothetical protein